MHSVISQGRVESLVTSKPRDRRLLIEEAAGLGKHRKRRRRAQLKLARTQDNLDRALDVEREARSRLRPLKRQAEAAELHERLERQSLEIRWELARDDVRGQRAAMVSAEAVAAEVRERRARAAGRARGRGQAPRGRRGGAGRAQRPARGALAPRLRRPGRRRADRLPRRVRARRRRRGRGAGWRATGDRGGARRRGRRRSGRPRGRARIAGLEESLAALDRDREAELARQLAELEEQLAEAGRRAAQQAEAVAAAQAERETAEAAAERVRGEVRDAERAVEAARREAARVGGELAAVNQFLRHQAGAPHGAAALADELDVDAGYELAVAAALDGRLRAAVVDDRAAGATLLDRAGADGGRTLVVGDAGDRPRATALPARPPRPRAPSGSLAHVRGQGRALTLARALLHDTWVVEDLDGAARRLRRRRRDPRRAGCGRRARASCARPRPSARSASWPSATAASSWSPRQRAPPRPSSTPAPGWSGPALGCRRPTRRATG